MSAVQPQVSGNVEIDGGPVGQWAAPMGSPVGLPASLNMNDSSEPFDQLKEATIVMVDDEPITTEVLQAFLEDAGYRNFVTTDRSVDALALIEAHEPDVVLLDLMMPEVSGFDILAAVRERPRFKHLPIIMLTSTVDAQTKLKALELGAADFLAKPVDPSELVLRIRNALAAKAYHDQLAYYDGATGLPNRQMFTERLGWAVRDAKRAGQSLAVVHVALDRFNPLGSTSGLNAVDAVVTKVAKRLEKTVAGDDSSEDMTQNLCRFGSEEFALMLPGLADSGVAGLIAKRILEALLKPLALDGFVVPLNPSIGVAVFPDDGVTGDEVLSYSVSASAHARRAGGGRYQFASADISARAAARQQLESDLRGALESRQLTLLYQPCIEIDSGQLRQVEALLRWQHPELGLLAPNDFISVAGGGGAARADWRVGVVRSLPPGGRVAAQRAGLAANKRQSGRAATASVGPARDAPTSARVQPARPDPHRARADRGGVDGGRRSQCRDARASEGAWGTSRHRPLRYRIFLAISGIRNELSSISTCVERVARRFRLHGTCLESAQGCRGRRR